MSPDYGIVAGFTHATSVTYTDRKGATKATIVASSSYQAGQAAESIGAMKRVIIHVRPRFVGGMTTWSFYVKRTRPAAGGITFDSSEIAIQRLDGTDAPTVAKDLVAADIVGSNSGAVGVDFISENFLGCGGTVTLMVKGNQAAANGDSFYATMELA